MAEEKPRNLTYPGNRYAWSHTAAFEVSSVLVKEEAQGGAGVLEPRGWPDIGTAPKQQERNIVRVWKCSQALQHQELKSDCPNQSSLKHEARARCLPGQRGWTGLKDLEEIPQLCRLCRSAAT